MKKLVTKLNFVIAVMSLLFTSFVLAEADFTQPTQNANAPYRLFNTKNMYNFLKLDTRSGQIWQVQWGSDVERFTSSPINDRFILDGEPGRFTLYPTANTWTFILLDQQMGHSWHVQWSLTLEERYVLPIP